MAIVTGDGDHALAVIRGSRSSRHDGRKISIVEPPTTGPRSFEVEDGQMSVVPPREGRAVQYIFGASGSGKSTWLSNYLAEWCHAHRNGKVYFVSRLSEDPAFEDLPVERIRVDEGLIDEPLTADEFPENCFVVFDDVDSIRPAALNDAVQGTLRDLLETGRHRGITVAVTSHLGSDYKRTRTILNECHGITFFPHGSSAQQVKYVLKTYGGLDNDQIKRVMKLPSRWIHLRKQYPPTIVYGGGAYLLCGE